MSIPQENKNIGTHLVMTIYYLVDRIIPYLVKFTFPLWALPILTGMFIIKAINFTKLIFSFLFSLFSPAQVPKLAFALVKGNGRYLKKNTENVLINQFYDYTSRKFMNIRELEPESKVVELQCFDQVGLKFLAENVRNGKVKGLVSFLNKPRETKEQSLVQQSNYSIKNIPSEGIDIFLLFNFKSKYNHIKKEHKVDLMKLLNYCQYHLSQQGYIVLGDYFQKGETETYKLLFDSFSLNVVEEEDITKNIVYAKYLMEKGQGQCEMKVFGKFKKIVSRVVGSQPFDEGKTFNVFILEKNNRKESHS